MQTALASVNGEETAGLLRASAACSSAALKGPFSQRCTTGSHQPPAFWRYSPCLLVPVIALLVLIDASIIDRPGEVVKSLTSAG